MEGVAGESGTCVGGEERDVRPISGPRPSSNCNGSRRSPLQPKSLPPIPSVPSSLLSSHPHSPFFLLAHHQTHLYNFYPPPTQQQQQQQPPPHQSRQASPHQSPASTPLPAASHGIFLQSPDPHARDQREPEPHVDQIQDDPPLDEEPLYVNAKQYYRILKRRVARARLEELHRLSRQRKVRLGSLHPRSLQLFNQSSSPTSTNPAISMPCAVPVVPVAVSSPPKRSLHKRLARPPRPGHLHPRPKTATKTIRT